MNRRGFGVAGVVAMIGLAAGGEACADDPRPNVVFVLVDDLRADALGCTGHPFAQTPHIDRLAREGATFRRAFVTLPLCSPSRASFLTGLYAHKHGVVDNNNHNELSHRLDTFPKRLRAAGYETAYVGKWHMGNDDAPRPGFDRWVSFKGQGAYVDPTINVDGRAAKVDGYMTDLLNEHAVEFVARERSAPFALYLAHKAIHGPFTPADRHKNLYADQAIERGPGAKDDLDDKPALRRPVPPAPGKKAAATKKQAATRPGGPSDATIRDQLRSLAAIDEGVGLLMAALERAGKLDETLFIFTSDNGYFWGEHGLGDKRWAYEESVRIPLLVRWPGHARPGSTIDATALNVDLAPTVLEAAGVAVPEGLHGRSLLPLLGGAPPDDWRKTYLTEYFLEPNIPRTPTWRAANDGRWKYIDYPDLDGMDELYDLETDPHELTNRIGDPAARGELDRLKAELARLEAASP